MPPEVLGGFEHQVLLAIARLDRETYTVPIVQEIERRTGREVAAASVFVTLRRLEARTLVSSSLAAQPGGQGGRPRRMFRLEAAGIAALRDAKSALESLWDGVSLADRA